MITFLKNKKTFLVAAALAIYAIAGLITGQLTLDQVISLLGLSGIGTTLKLGQMKR